MPLVFLVSDACYVENVPSEIHSVLSTLVTNLYCNLFLHFPLTDRAECGELEQCFTHSAPWREQIEMWMCRESSVIFDIDLFGSGLFHTSRLCNAAPG